MSRVLGVAVYLAGLAFAEALRARWRVSRVRSRRTGARTTRSARLSEGLVVGAIALGIWALPIAYAFTGWLAPFDYSCPAWAVLAAVVVFGAGLAVRWLAQRSLGRHWSPTLEIGPGQELVEDGIYGRVRHPLYASLIPWAAAQPVLLQNVLAGWGGPVAVALVWLVRVPREEAMMMAAFGDQYRRYKARTGALLPRRRA